MKPSPEPQDPAIAKAVESLQHWEQQVDAVQAARLAAARRTALAAAPAAPVWRSPWLGSALAAGLLLTVGLNLRSPPPASPSAPALQASAAPAEALLEEGFDDELLDADLDLTLALSGLDEAT